MQSTNPLRAAAWMMGAVASFIAMAVAGREILVEMNTFELMLYRSGLGLAVIALVIGQSRAGFTQVRTQILGQHLKRNAFHFAGQNLWFFAVAAIPLSQLVALEFTNPIWVALLAPVLLGEKLTRPRVLGAVLGFFGVLIVAQPGRAPLEPGHAAALASALCFAMNTLFTKRIMQHDKVLCVIFWMTLMQGTAAFVLAMPGGIPLPTAATGPWLVVVGLTGLSAHYCLTSALGHAPATVVAPMEFIRLPLVALLGMWVYGEPLRPAVFAGAGLIIVGNLITLRAETRPQVTAPEG